MSITNQYRNETASPNKTQRIYDQLVSTLDYLENEVPIATSLPAMTQIMDTLDDCKLD